MKINNSNRFLLIDPPSVHHGPPASIFKQDQTLSQFYSQTLDQHIQKYFSENGIKYLTSSPIKYISNYGLLMIGQLLKQRGHYIGYENGDYFSSIDEFVDHILIIAKKYDCICFSCTTPQYLTVKRIAKMICEKYNIPLVLGGPHISFAYQEQDDFPFSAIITGYNIEQSVGHIEYICNSYPLEEVIILKTNGYVDVQRDFSLIPKDKLRSTLLYSYSSFGCPNKCSYCIEKKLTNKLNFSNCNTTLSEVEFLVNECNKKFIHLADSDFFIYPTHAEAFLNALENSSIKACYSVNTNPKTLLYQKNIDLIKRFSKQGLVELLVGVEYFSNSVLSLMNKEYDIEKFYDAISLIRKEAPNVIISFYSLVGLPGETKETQKENYSWFKRFFDEKLVDFSFPKFFIPYPGTDVYCNPDFFGVKIKHKNWDEYHRWTNQRPIIISEMTDADFLDELIDLYQIAGAHLSFN